MAADWEYEVFDGRELPGMWEEADFLNGAPDEYRPPANDEQNVEDLILDA